MSGSRGKSPAAPSSSSPRASVAPLAAASAPASAASGGPASHAAAFGFANLLPGMPTPLSPTDVYAADRAGNLSPTVRDDRPLVYVPNTNSNTVTVIDQRTMKVINTFPGGHEPQHVVPSYDLKTLYVAADYVPASGGPGDGSLTPINPRTGTPGTPIPIDDPYNLYYTPDGKFAIVVAESRKRLDFYDPHTWQRKSSLAVPTCDGVDHIDFTADGRTLLATCEFADAVIAVDVSTETVVRTISLPRRSDGMPQDIKLSPDGRVFYVADMMANGVYLIDASSLKVIGFMITGTGAHGLYVDRTSTRLFVTNRLEGSISIIDLGSRRQVTKWYLPGGGSPDMGNVSADGTVLWLSGRYNNVVYALSTVDGHLIAKIPVGAGPHGLCVWPVPGRYSLGHTGILR
ncbi:MAG: YncE family protein [Actinomycetota bacterium]|nr:YncE family protein [Actinomycetota bacterium]